MHTLHLHCHDFRGVERRTTPYHDLEDESLHHGTRRRDSPHQHDDDDAAYRAACGGTLRTAYVLLPILNGRVLPMLCIGLRPLHAGDVATVNCDESPLMYPVTVRDVPSFSSTPASVCTPSHAHVHHGPSRRQPPRTQRWQRQHAGASHTHARTHAYAPGTELCPTG